MRRPLSDFSDLDIYPKAKVPRLVGAVVLRCLPCLACPWACRRALWAYWKIWHLMGRVVVGRHGQLAPVPGPTIVLLICGFWALALAGLDHHLWDPNVLRARV